jgi:hypothetical protein
MGGDIMRSNFRKLGEVDSKEYHFSWFLEEDETHPTQMYLTRITHFEGELKQERRSYPIKVLRNIAKELNLLLRYREDSHICPECGGERGLTNDCPTCNG